MQLPIEDAIDLKRAAKMLRGHKRTVFWLRLAGFTLIEVARYIGLTRERVRQIECQLQREIREWLAREGPLGPALDRARYVTAARRAEDAARNRAYMERLRHVSRQPRGFRRCEYGHCPTPWQSVTLPRNTHLACARLKQQTRYAQRMGRVPDVA